MSAEKKNSKNKQACLALTGSGFKGQALLEWLEKNPAFNKVVYLSNKKPHLPLKKSRYYRIDLTETLADAKIAEILKKEKVETLVHTALPITPPHDLAKAHELISVGSMYLVNAAAEAKLKKLILASTADVYGAFANNPNYLSEKHPPRGGLKSRFLKDKIDAENRFLSYAKKNPQACVTILRPATILGPNVRSYKTKYFKYPVVATVWGYDPLVQFIHEEDLLAAFKKVIIEDHPGIFNLASQGVIPLSKALKLMGKINLPLTLLGLKTLVQSLWYLDISPAPANRLDFLKYLWLVATDKAQSEMGFFPQHDCKSSILDFVGSQRLESMKLKEEKG